MFLFSPLCCWTPLCSFQFSYNFCLVLSYIFYFLFETLTTFILSSLWLIVYLWSFNWIINQVLCLSPFHLIRIFFWEFALFFSLEPVPLSPHLSCFYVFVYMYLGEMATSLSLEGTVLCRNCSTWPGVQSPQATRTRQSMGIPRAGFVCLPFVVGLQPLQDKDGIWVADPSQLKLGLCACQAGPRAPTQG